MKPFLMILSISVFVVSPAFASEFSNCNQICILESSWDGSKYVNHGETYSLLVQIPPEENLDVKIHYYDQSIVHEKIYSPDESGKILIQYTSPDEEDSLSYYRVNMHLVEMPDVKAGAIFRIGDTYNLGFFPIQSIPWMGEAKVGDTIRLWADNNNRWSMPMIPNHSFNATLYDPSGSMVYHNTITTDGFGDFDDIFHITEPGFYKLVFEDDNSQQVRFFPRNFDVVKTISAEGKDFDFKFGFEDRGIMFSVEDMIFDQQGKSLKIITDNPTNEHVRFEISIPHEFLNGNMTTLMDGELRTDFDQRHILGHSITVFKLPPGEHTVEIIGTSAIPEFQTIAMFVLLVSILPVIFLRKQLVIK